MSTTDRPFLTIIFALSFILLWSGCENSIDPIADEGENAFAVFGYLDMRVPTQKVRVELLRPTILSDPISLEGVQVSTIDRNNGTFQIWRDSSVVLDDGSAGVVYVAQFRPELGHTYSLLISRNDKLVAEAIAELPIKPAVTVATAVGDSLNVTQHLTFLELTDQPVALFVLYEVIPPDDSGVDLVRVGYGNPRMATVGGWEFDIDLSTDRFAILNALGLNVGTKDVKLKKVSMEMTLFSKEWSQPEKGDNLEHLIGFFASVGVFEHSWTLNSETVTKMGFVDAQQGN